MLKFETISYSQALLALAKETKSLEIKLGESRNLIKFFQKPELIYKTFSSAFISKKEKKELFTKLFPSIDKHFLYLFWILVKRHSEYKFAAILDKFITLTLLELGIIEGTIYSTIPLEEEKIKHFEKVTSKQFSKKVFLENKIDTQLIGGIKIEIDNHIIELSFASLLEETKTSFLNKKRALGRLKWL